jgi:hypothetical protein
MIRNPAKATTPPRLPANEPLAALFGIWLLTVQPVLGSVPVASMTPAVVSARRPASRRPGRPLPGSGPEVPPAATRVPRWSTMTRRMPVWLR